MTIGWCWYEVAGSGGGRTGPMPIWTGRWGIWPRRVKEHQREVYVIQKERVNRAKIGLPREVPQNSLAQSTISAYRP